MSLGSGPKKTGWRAGDLFIDPGRQRLERSGEILVLPKLSFDLLCVLLRAAPDFVSNDELMAQVWPGLVVSPETVTQRVKLLRDALQDDRLQPRYIEGLRGRGYRFIADVAAESASGELPDHAAERFPSPPAAAQVWRSAPWLAAGVTVVLVLSAWLAWSHLATRPEAAGATGVAATNVVDNTVAVLPFESLSSDPADYYFGPGLSEAILNGLSRVRGLTVIARESVTTASRQPVDIGAAGRRLGAGYVVAGSTLRNDRMLRVNARLVRSRDGAQVWAQQFDRALADIFQMQDEIATQVVQALQTRVANLAPAVNAEHRPANLEAYLAYLHGRVLLGRFTVGEADAAAAEFSRAIALDPSFAPALVALFDARMQSASLRRLPLTAARAQYGPLLQSALQLDPASGPAWYARAMWAEADKGAVDLAFRRGVQLDPGNSRGLTAYSEFLDQQGRSQEAKEMLDAALRVDPLAARARFRLAQRSFPDIGASVERYTLATLELDPTFYPALQRYAKYRWMQHGDIAQAIAIAERAIASDPGNPWARHSAAAFYLDLRDAEAASAVVRDDPTARASARAMLAAYGGDWRAAGEAAMADGSFVFNDAERWCVVPALRDYALRSGEFTRIQELIAARYKLPLDGQWKINVFNFREAELQAHLQLAQRRNADARKRLQAVIDWIDANEKYGPVYNTRTKAQALMLLGRRDEALALLAQSFAQHDYTHWWYALERDPTWDAVRRDPRFVAIARDVRAYIATQRQALQALRENGTVPQRRSDAS